MRTPPAPTGDEVQLLTQHLQYQRETILVKTAGLTGEQLARTNVASLLIIGGILNHLALVEDAWFQVRFLGLPEEPPWDQVDWDADPDFEFRTASELTPEQLQGRYRLACDRSNRVTEQAEFFEQLSVQPRRDGTHFSLRWMLLHLLAETARHAGHADLLREAIDESTGD